MNTTSVIGYLLCVMSISCADQRSQSRIGINSTLFEGKASFARQGYQESFVVKDLKGNVAAIISCYSLNDKSREDFATKFGSDPVADLSCYANDVRQKDEFTMLGLAGESLQFTPAFFWLNDVGRCAQTSYHMEAWLRGMKYLFEFSEIDLSKKSAKLKIVVTPMAAATNKRLTKTSYRIYCT